MRIKFKTITNGIFNCLTDLLLWEIGLFSASFGKTKSTRDVYRIFSEANDFLDKYNHNSLSHVINKLKKQGLIELIKEEGYLKFQITQLGEQRINSLLPIYQNKRPWNRKFYLITYDIPESKRNQRNILRGHLKKLGAGLLQESVWICPYNIKKILDDFIIKNYIQGTIIVSNTGKDGSIGDISLKELIIKTYNLDILNERYREFIKEAKESHNKQFLATKYVSILKDDPQIPFELLSDWWEGDRAYLLYQKLSKTML